MSWKIPKEKIDAICAECEEQVWEPFPGITIVAWQMPNGFVISEQSGTIDPAEYSLEIGVKCCRERLTDKVWELEGYVRKNEWAEAKGGE